MSSDIQIFVMVILGAILFFALLPLLLIMLRLFNILWYHLGKPAFVNDTKEEPAIIELQLEQHKDLFYLYLKDTDEFLSQSDNVTALTEYAANLYPRNIIKLFMAKDLLEREIPKLAASQVVRPVNTN